MLYIRLENGLPVETTEKHPGCGPDIWVNLRKIALASANGWISARDFESKIDADAMAQYLTAMKGAPYLGCDAGSGHYPRYTVVAAPRLGDEVSYGFNGDYYPCGKITRITKGWRVTTDGGKTFNRYKETGGWRMVGGTWWMVDGVVDERNPHI